MSTPMSIIMRQYGTNFSDYNQIWMINSLKTIFQRIELETMALYAAYKDNRTPWYAKIFAAYVVAYALSPIDLIPDFIPLVGYLDDMILLPLGIWLAWKMIPAAVKADAYVWAQNEKLQKRPVNKLYILLVILFWLLILIIFGKFIWSFVGQIFHIGSNK